jgi:hypothetical protein
MAKVTILKHKRDQNFKVDFLKWVREKDIKTLGISHEDLPKFFQILVRFSNEMDAIKSIQESSHFITDNGLHHIAVKLLEEFIKEDTHYIILDNIEVFEGDHMLVILAE